MALISPVLAGQASIYPTYPMSSSTGIFTADAKQITTNVFILLVVPESGVPTATASVSWTEENGGTAGTANVAQWRGPIPNDGSPSADGIRIPEGNYILPLEFKQAYTGASLQSHLGTGSEPIYYAWVPTTMVLDDEQVTITVNMPTSNPKVLVYIVGQSSSAAANELDVYVPPTNAGFFVVPEYFLGGLVAIGACFAAFVAFKKLPVKRMPF